MPILAVSVNHRTAPVEVREALAFDPGQARRFLAEEAAGLPERILLSTCNRTELYAVTPNGDPGVLLDLLEKARPGVELDAPGRAERYRDDEAVRHLLRVACGLESMVLGEAQILGQVKEAGELAAAAGAAGVLLRRALEVAARTAKKARTSTAIGEGAVSVASAAVELARRIYGDLSDRIALVVGAGETGRLVARHLRAAGIGRMLLANRTLGRAREVATEVKAEPRGLCGVPPALREADIVVCSTASETPILTEDEVRAAMRARKDRMLLLLDIAVPRDVDPAASRIASVFLHDIDALRDIVDANLELRRKAVPRVEALVEEAVRGYAAWRRGLSVVPTIKALRARFEEIREAELKANLKRVPPEAREAAERLTRSLVKRLLHTPSERLRKAGGEAEGAALSAPLREIFDLPEEPGE